MTHAQIILAVADYVIEFFMIAAATVAANTALENWRLHRLMDRRVSRLFPRRNDDLCGE
jgi:hypothetical protein